MGLQITCEDARGVCRLNVKQDGYEASPRWLRYYAVTARGWQVSLLALKRYAETVRRQSLKIPDAPPAPVPVPVLVPRQSVEAEMPSTAFSDLMNASSDDSEKPPQ
jgi:hypothetical protein